MVIKKKYPLTSVQRDIYYEQILYPNSSIYNIGAKIKIQGQLNIALFIQAYSKLIHQHDAYRIQIVIKNNEPYQIFTNSDHYELIIKDFSNEANANKFALKYIERQFSLPFSFKKDKLLHRFELIKADENLHYLFSVYHHIITDGWGTSLMFQRLVNNYNELSEYGKVKSEYPYSYKNFIQDDKEYQDSESIQKDLVYWEERFKILPDNLFTNSKENKFISDRKEFFIERKDYNSLENLAKQFKCSTFHIILGILFTYFSRFYQNNDISIGIPVLNRGKAVFKKTVGLFMGLSPLRIGIDFENSFEELVVKIKQQLRVDYRHQRLPLGKLVQEKNLYTQKDKLFNITLSYEKQNYSNHFLNTKTTVIPLSHKSEKVALAIYIREFDENTDVKIDFDYNLSFFDKTNIGSVTNGFSVILNQILIDSSIKIKDLDIAPRHKTERILNKFNHTKYTKNTNQSILTAFKFNVTLFPNKVSVNDGNIDLTYLELDTLSNHVASKLSSEKSPVAILLNRSSHLLAIKLGVLKSFRAFIPLDPKFPMERLQYIIGKSGCKTIITEKNIENEEKLLDSTNIQKYYLSDLLNIEFTEADYSTPNSNQTAYVIYTSGSTGNPKGVEISHGSLANFLNSMKCKPGLKENDILYAVTTTSFDISILELFLPLISGGTVFIAEGSILSDPQKIISELKTINPTVIQATPSFYQMLYNTGWEGCAHLKILCGGDLLSETLANKLLTTNSEVWNMYGPTETTIWSSTKQILKSEEFNNIGKPIDNTSLYILDQWFNPVPIGAIGNLYIGGHGLAKGYYLNQKLTNEKFIESDKLGERIYDTGDFCKWNNDGDIIFLGRNDNQVKIRGYRIELGEIEKRLATHKTINQAVVIAQKQEDTQILVAYIISISNYDENSIFDYLEKTLPPYMIPQHIIEIDHFPLTSNRKINRKELQERDIKIKNQNVKLFNSETEIRLSKIWKQLLQVDEISVNDNFFRLGGDSLKAAKLVYDINTQFKTTLIQSEVFKNPTIKKLAKLIKERKSKDENHIIEKAKNKDFYDLTYPQKNIWLASQIEKGSLAYNMNIGFNLKGELNVDYLNQSFQKVIEEYEILRTNFIEVDGIPKQKIKSPSNVDFQFKCIDSVEGDKSFFDQVFDLEKDCLLRVLVFNNSDKSYKICFSTHHIILDGWSVELLIKAVSKQYNALIKQTKLLDKTTEQYDFKDYSEYTKKQIKNKKSEHYWKQELNDYKPHSAFETSLNEPFSFKGNSHQFKIDKEDIFILNNLAKQENKTVFTILLSIFFSFVNALEGKEDVCLGAVISGRDNKIWDDVLGMFVNTIPIRLSIKKSKNLIDVVKNIENKLINASEHQSYPIAEDMTNYNAVIDTLVVYQNPEFSFDELSVFEGIELKPIQHESKTCRLPLTFNFYNEKTGSMLCDVEFSLDRYSKDDILYLSEKFKIFLAEQLKNPNAKIEAIDFRLETERQNNVEINFNY